MKISLPWLRISEHTAAGSLENVRLKKKDRMGLHLPRWPNEVLISGSTT